MAAEHLLLNGSFRGGGLQFIHSSFIFVLIAWSQ